MPPKNQAPPRVNFSDYLAANKDAVAEMQRRVLARENDLKNYAIRGRNELKDRAIYNATNNGDTDYQKTDEFKRYTDTSNAYSDYLKDEQSNAGRQMQLMADYGAGVNESDAALLYGIAPRAQTVKPSKWDDYLTGVNMDVEAGKRVWDSNAAQREQQQRIADLTAQAKANAQAKYEQNLANQAANGQQGNLGNRYGAPNQMGQLDEEQAKRNSLARASENARNSAAAQSSSTANYNKAKQLSRFRSL